MTGVGSRRKFIIVALEMLLISGISGTAHHKDIYSSTDNPKQSSAHLILSIYLFIYLQNELNCGQKVYNLAALMLFIQWLWGNPLAVKTIQAVLIKTRRIISSSARILSHCTATIHIHTTPDLAFQLVLMLARRCFRCVFIYGMSLMCECRELGKLRLILFMIFIWWYDLCFAVISSHCKVSWSQTMIRIGLYCAVFYVPSNTV